MSQNSVDLLESLSNAHSVSGYEDEVREIFIAETEGTGTLGADRTGSIYREKGTAGPRVLVTGHMDEVGFQVQAITSDGFIKFRALGGWWSHTLPAQRVFIKTEAGNKVLGLIATEPVHFLPESKRSQVVPLTSMFIDVGATSREEVASWGIALGDPVAPATEFVESAKKGRYIGKAFDNRVGMAGAIEVLKAFENEEHPNVLIGAGTCQEEVGLRGAKTLAHKVKPDVAIVLEGPPADDLPGYPRDTGQGLLGEGVQVRLSDPSALMNPRLGKLVKEVAEKEGIPFQLTVRTSGGTDAGSFHLSGDGVPSIVLGVPARYIHSHQSMIELGDYTAMLDLSIALVKALDEEAVEGLFDFGT